MKFLPNIFRGHNSLPSILDDFFDDDDFKNIFAHKRQSKFLSPSIDVIDDTDKYILKADLPGVNKKDIKVEVKDGFLTISGERKEEKDVKDEGYHRQERFYGRFQRSFPVGEAIMEDKVEAKYNDGVLTLELPKKEEAIKKKTVKVIDVK
ncbi:MAG: Hsp20/alpha crystallin family protein [Oligoflexia bacterium]|nr:Hsp20/alpha crystallin family protein [Oligoflexia bacterium]